jgi:hypothetical protein
LKRVLILLFSLLPASSILLSCGGYSSPSSGGGTGIKYRAFITNNVSAGTGFAGVYIVDAAKDLRGSISPISAGNTPGMMVVTPNRTQTLVFSGNGTQFSDNQFTIINNATEAAAGQVTLPGLTESFVVSPDSSAAYVAVPAGRVAGQSQGVIDVISLSSGTKTAEISCPPKNPNPPDPPPPPTCVTKDQGDQGFNPPYRFLSIGNTGNRVLAFSEGSNSVANAIAVITPSSVGTANPVVTFVSGSGPTAFDHPVWAFFNSDDTIAYVVNCGAECGGTQASVQTLDLRTNTAGTPIPVPAATVALVNNSTMYLAGTPLPNPNPQPCTGETTQATSCGLLTVFDLSRMTVTNTTPIIITDGYHNRMALGANGQLFIGARTCTEIVPPIPPPPGAEVRGCLSIYNTQNVPVGSIQPGAVTIPPTTGDVTGIQPVATRDVVYVVQGQNVQGGTLYVYDTKTDAVDAVEEQKLSNLIGDFVDVKTIDF